MDRHFLVAVSEQKSALDGIRFLSSFFSDKEAVKSTLFYSCPKPPLQWENEENLDVKARLKEQAKKMTASDRQVLDTVTEKSIALGLLKANLYQKLKVSDHTAVDDIIQEGQAGRYDAVILGRRSLGLIESALEGSVSKSLLQARFTFPLWLCRSVNTRRKHILLYGDGSEMSYSMADHAGRMAGLEHRHRVDILLEEKHLADDAAKNKYRSILAKHGMTGDHIAWLPSVKGDQAAHILRLVKENGYAAVALGRSHPEKSIFSRLFKGPVSSVLFKELQEASLWVGNWAPDQC